MTHVRTRLMLSAAYASQPITPEVVAMARAARASNPDLVSGQSDDMTRRSKDSKCMLPYWDQVATLLEGIRGMRNAGETYLPRFRDEDPDDYGQRLKMTKMTNVYKDILEGLAAKPFEQLVTLRDDSNPPQTVLDFIEDVDGSGNNLTVFAANVFFNGINNAIHWIYVDHSNPPQRPRNLAEYRAQGNRVYWSHVDGSNVLDVRTEMIGGKETITYFKMLEPGDDDCVREFKRDDTGYVTWTLWEKEENAVPAEWRVKEQGDISIGVIPMVPFVTGRRIGRTWRIDPPMLDAADLQVELFQQESGLKFAKTLTAYPMLAANGIKPEKDDKGKPVYKVAVGPNRVLFTGTGSDGKVGSWSYVEPSSESLKFLAEDINHTIRELRELGRQPLTVQSSNITVTTAAVAARKAKSAVKAWAIMLKDALENALILTGKWTGETYVPNVHVYTDFDDFMDGTDLDTLNTARTNKDISRETYWAELKRRAVLTSDFNPVTETTRLLQELPGDPVIDEGVQQ